MTLLFKLFFLHAIVGSSISQPVTILIKDEDKNPLIGATVQLTKIDDGTTHFSTTNLSGIARFDGVDNAHYIAYIRYVGFISLENQMAVSFDLRHFEFQMEEDAVKLDEVKVLARRPLIRQEDDKMIIDPEPLSNISTSTLEVLENTPGLFVDHEGGIFLGSTSPAAIFINGREQKLSNQDITTILRSLPPGSVQRIEVMTTPSTKYDAASSGGIINIVLKKGVKIGRFGSITTGMNQGVHGNRFAGFSMNNSGEKTTSYVNANYNYNGQVEDLNSIRLLSGDTALNQSSRNRMHSDQGYTGFGISYDVTEKINLSYDSRINASMRRSVGKNINFIEGIDNHRLAENHNLINNRSEFLSLQQDLGMSWKLDSMGSQWDTKFGYSYNNNSSLQNYQTSYILPAGLLKAGEGDNLQKRQFLLLQTDLIFKLPRKVIIETGIKSTYQHYDSQADYFFNNNGQLVEDRLRTNAYNYQECINAMYAQSSIPLPGNLILKTGVRMEHTNMRGNQTIPEDVSFIVNRVNWFPYTYLSRKIVEIANYELRGYIIYRRTIGRPGYQSLNPSIKYIDQYLYEMGNPALKPQLTENYEANISFDNTPIFAIGRKHTRDIFSSVIYKDEQFDNVAVRTYDNIGKNKETYFRITGAIPPGGRYFFVAGTQYNLNEYEGFYENQPMFFNRGSWILFTFHSLNLTGQTRLTMMGFMMLKGQQNFYELNTFGQLNFGLNQSLLNKKLNITLSGRDVLRTMVTQFSLNQGTMHMYGDRYSDNQRFGINIRYMFGTKKKEKQHEMFQFDPEK